jgi:hypothetical protein
MPLEWSTGVPKGLVMEIVVEVTEGDKHSSLLRYRIIYSCKVFIVQAHRCQCFKTCCFITDSATK